MNSENLPENLKPIFTRRSCRSFRKDPVPEEHIEILFQALRWAPSGGNRQPWHFYQVRNMDIIKKLAEAAGSQTFITGAPLLFVICTIPEKSAARYGERGRSLYCLQDTAAAVENLLLAATALDYGTCWIGAFDESRVSEILKIPDDLRPVAMVPVGKPAKLPRAPLRKTQDEILTIVE